ncbi:MAG: TIGR03663 family protein, partial [Chloroflexota bacterium]|nr:TIGR03663 family protein [Chloroflexota bacterium]
MISETYAPAEVPVRRSPLDRGIDLSRINAEWLAYGLLFLASLVLHFWQLGQMAMAHDESIHAWASFRFFTGRGSFECAGGRTSVTYCYEPTYHGPTLYFLTLFSYFLFGDGDAVARLPQTLAGIALVPACYLLRPLFGKRPALIGAVLVTLSPSILYFARYARHDALMLLWTLLFVAGLFRWIERGGTADLVLAAASLALAWATHELVFILIFIAGTFLIFRLFWESRPRLFVILAALGLNLAIIVALATVATSSNPSLNKILDRLLGPAMLGGAGALMALLLTRSWPAAGMLTSRLRATWATRANADEARPRTIMGSLPASVWWALGTFLLIFGILFSTFLAYPRGFLDGWYQGLKYWWFSQQDFRRGGQPWFYYLMLLPTYELMALVFALGGIVWLSWGHRDRLTSRSSNGERAIAPAAGQGPVDGDHPPVGHRTADGNHRAAVYEARDGGATPGAHGLFVPFLAYWSVLSLIAFSWAGEKMPWLVIQIALPVTLLAAWVLSELMGGVPWRMVGRRYGWSVPPLVLAAIVLGGVGVYYLSGGGATLAALRDRLRALPALAMFGAAIFGLVAVAANIGVRNVLRLAALTVAAILLLYGIRAAVQVVYLHPDTPVEPLIYTQTAPDVPVFVDQIQRLAINQTRNNRSTDDPTGGYSMKVTVDKDLAWPFQWYLRDFRSVTWADCQKNQCTGGDAPVVLLHKPNITETIRDELAEDYVRTGQGVFNWWFPENYKELRNQGPWAVLSWPFRPANWPTLTRFMIYRE